VDLVFYNYLLKCFVLLDLKTKKLTHADIGQMDMYVRLFDDLKRGEGDNPNRGCSEEDQDAVAAYTHALLFALDGDVEHARAAASIMNNYSSLKEYTGFNAPLRAGWSASKWTRAAELVVHAEGGGADVWPLAEADAFRAMLRRVALLWVARA
jgi:hypothetical protein